MLWSDWPLLLSSVLAQLAIGAFLFLGGAILTGKLCFWAKWSCSAYVTWTLVPFIRFISDS